MVAPAQENRELVAADNGGDSQRKGSLTPSPSPPRRGSDASCMYAEAEASMFFHFAAGTM